MQAVLLAGGAGKRVFPLSAEKPKPMFKLLGKPLFQHVIERLKEAGLTDFIVVVGHHGEQIQEFLGNGEKFGVTVKYAFQKEALGMANALEAAEEFVQDHFFVVNADDIFESSLFTEMIKDFNAGEAEIVLSCKPVTDTWKFGIIQLGKNKNVTRLVEKPPKGLEPSNLAVIGVYILTKKIFEYYTKVGVSDHQFEDAIQQFIQDGNRVHAVSYSGFFAGYKYPWDLFTINQHLMETQIKTKTIEDGAEISPKATMEGNIWIRKGAKILEGACIRGPAYIGKNSIIGNNCLIRNHTSIGDDCVIGFSTEIKNSLIGENCSFHMNFIGDSIISDNCLFGAGAVTANFRFDQKTVAVIVDGKKVDSGHNHLGTIMGHNCKAGVNSCLPPGSKIGPGSIVGPGVTLHGDLEPGKTVFQNKDTLITRNNTIV